MCAFMEGWQERRPDGSDLWRPGHIVQSKGRWAGQPLELYQLQRAFLNDLHRTDRSGIRIHREGLLGLPRKNGKSTIAAPWALYMLVGDGEPGAEVYAAATSRAQARIVFGEAKRMVEKSPWLSSVCRVYRDAIEYPDTESVFRVLSSEAGVEEGLNPHAVVIDELHAARDRELFYVLTSGSDAREQPLFLYITTAGFDRDTIAFEVFDRGLKGEDDELCFWWVGLDEHADFEDEGLWKSVNPAPWIDLKRLRAARKRYPLPIFARRHLNAWTQAQGSWLPAGAWGKCKGEVGIRNGDRVHAGADTALFHDHCGVAEVKIVRPQYDDDGELVADERVTACRCDGDRAADPETGRCAACDGRLDDAFEVHVLAYDFEPPAKGGRAIDFSEMRQLARDLRDDRELVRLGYDPVFGGAFAESAQTLADEGVPIEVVSQGNKVMAPISQTLYDLVIDRRIVHDGDPILAAHVQNAAVRDVGEWGWRVSKAKSRAFIDLLTALLEALHLALEPEPPPPTEPGVRFLS